jgi:hypothetical protein
LALKERLGDDATLGLVDFVDAECSAWSGRVLTTAVQRLDAAAERYDGKLAAAVERCEAIAAAAAERYDSKLAAIEHRFDAKLDARLSVAAERYERRLAEEISGLRVAVVREIHEGRVEIIKWSFLFWLGQVAALFALFSFMLRPTTH